MTGRPARVLASLAAVGVLLGGCGGGDKARTTARTAPAVTSENGAGHRFYELYDAVGPARGTLLLLHSGGWRDKRGDARRIMVQTALGMRAQGWRVLNVSYSPGPPKRGDAFDPRPMMRDVVAFYDQVKAAYDGPVCAYGESAGGHLAAMLALERPTLKCAVLAAAPLDLPRLLKDSASGGKQVRGTFGAGTRLPRTWSPTVRWRTAHPRVAVFATSARNDKVVPPSQLRAFARENPEVNAATLPGERTGDRNGIVWMHSTVRYSALIKRLTALTSWLNRKVPRAEYLTLDPATSVGSECADPAVAARDGAALMRAGDAWRQVSSAGRLIAATRGCSGSERWQDDGLSLWAPPTAGKVLPRGTQAAISLSRPRALTQMSATIRGYLARPQDWTVGLYASSGTSGAITGKVAVCDRGRCDGLRLVRTKHGSLIAPKGYHGNPDSGDAAPRLTVRLPAGTRRVAWRLRCAARKGCALDGGTARAAHRRRDPLGHPAILSVYRADVR